MAYHSLETLLEYLKEDETALGLIQRLHQEQLHTGLGFLDGQLRLRPGSIMEVAGPGGCGKTLMLIRMAAHCVVQGVGALAPEYTSLGMGAGAAAGGLRSSVLFVDMDGKMNFVHMVQVVRSKLDETFPSMSEHVYSARHLLATHLHGPLPAHGAGPMPDLAAAQQLLDAWERMVADCMARIHVIRAHSSLQALAGLLSAQNLLNACKASHVPCRLLLLDNVGAFSYLDKPHRACAYQPQASITPATEANSPCQPHQPPWGVAQRGSGQYNPGGAPQGQWDVGQGPAGGFIPALPTPPPPLSVAKVHSALAAVLHALSAHFRVCVITTKHVAVTAMDADGHGPARLQAKEYLPSTWTQQVTHRLVLGPPVVVAGRQPGTVATRIPAQLSQGSQSSPIVQLFVDDYGMDTLAQ